MRKNRWSLAGCAAALAALAAGALADDTVFFSNNVPPNVLLFIDESGSMRNIIQHPYFEAANAPFIMSDLSTCEVMTLADSASNTFPDESSPVRHIKLVTGGTTGHRFEPWRDERPDWTATASALDDPDQGYVERKYCGNTRKIYTDVFMDTYTRTLWPKDYLDWYFHLEPAVVYNHPDPAVIETKTGAEIITEIESATNGRDFITGNYYPQYQISRMWAAKLVAKEVMYRTNTDCPAFLGDCGIYDDRVRFGIAVFRSGNHGGFVSAEPAAYTTGKASLETAVDNLITRTSTPLGETLFQLYTYFMKRGESAADDDDRPNGIDGTAFPNYAYELDGTHSSTPSDWAPDPFAWDCQKQFIIMITDGAPSHDQFLLSGSVTQKFDKFYEMVGDYAPDLVTEDDWNQSAPAWSIADPSKEEGTPPWPQSHNAGYLDDIAEFIQDHDLRGDIAGNQTVDVYTVGFTTIGAVNTLLFKTARNGNGKFLAAGQADELALSVSEAIRDIVEKSQAFASASVPASRSTDGNNFFVSYFDPSNSNPFWPGHLKLFDFNTNGEILDAPVAEGGTGQCALDDPLAPARCRIGALNLGLDGFWDAAEEIPAAGSRNLYVSNYPGSPPGTIPVLPPEFTDQGAGQLTPADLGIAGATAADIATYDNGIPGFDLTGINTDTELADAIVGYIRGCEFDNGACTDRGLYRKLWDIFHSNPLLIGPPNAGIHSRSYRDFVLQYKHRKRVIYAGSNGGFVHGFNAGVYDTGLTPPRYDRGTGVEEFGFMAYPARQNIALLPKDEPPRGEGSWNGYTMDGPVTAADAWFYSDAVDDPDDADMSWQDWRTVLVGGMREGGRVVWSLDVTDPDGIVGNPTMYPGYLWEFPCEASSCDGWRPYMGETWSQPVITRVKATIDCDGSACATYDRWVAIFGAGYDQAGDPNQPVHETVPADVGPDEYDASDEPGTSRAGRALFMIDIRTGEVLGAKRYDDAGSAHDSSDGEPEMLYALASAPSVFDTNFDGYADVVVVGDLGGNVWKWVIHDPAQDHINGTQGTDQQARWPFFKLMQAENCTACSPPHYKSFYNPPTGAMVGPKLVLALGSGERQDLTHGQDGGLSTPEKNRFYVFRDKDPLGLEYDSLSPPAPYTDVSPSIDFIDGATILDFNPHTCLSGGHVGFYLEGDQGEKFITDSTIFFGVLFTASYIPPPSTADICEATGTAYLYGFDLLCGEGRFPPASGLPADPNERRIQVGQGLPNAPRVSVGDTSEGSGDPDDPDDPCKDMVIMITSENGGFSGGRCERQNTGLGVNSWRDR